MVDPKVTKKWKIEKVKRTIENVLLEFSERLNGQVNLSASAAQSDIASAIASRLDARGLIGRFPNNSKE